MRIRHQQRDLGSATLPRPTHSHRAFIAALLVLVFVAAPTAGQATDYFTDDAGSVHETDINGLAEAGITKGCNPPDNTTYCPNNGVTRAQMAAFLVRALKLPSTTEDFFTDDNGSIFETDINALAASGITKGCNPPDNTTYCPNNGVTRAQMAAFLVRALKLPSTTEDFFTDDNGSIFETDINALAASGITKGCNPPDNTTYCPNNGVTRAQMASFLVRALDLSVVPKIYVSDTQELAGVAFGSATEESLQRLTVQFGDPSADSDGSCPYFLAVPNIRYVEWGSLSVAFDKSANRLVGWRYKLESGGDALPAGPRPDQFVFPFPHTFGDQIGEVDNATGDDSVMLATPFEFFVLDFGTFMLEAAGFVPDAAALIDGAQQGFGFFCD